MEFIVEKIGMSRTVAVPSTSVTLLKVKETKVVEVNDDKALVAYSDGKKFNKTIEGMQKKYDLSKEFNRFAQIKVANTETGDLDLTALTAGTNVKATFTSKGRGFSGVIKRHGFAGGPGAHGSRFHRAPGSIGNCEWPGRVQKGKKMPGHYGTDTKTVKNEILSFDAETGIIVVKGSVPGANGALGRVRIAK
jgi:large subunit ribosomal protein L3